MKGNGVIYSGFVGETPLYHVLCPMSYDDALRSVPGIRQQPRTCGTHK